MNDTQKGYAGKGNARKPSDRRAQTRAPMTTRMLEFITPAPFPSLRKTRLARLLSPILWCGLLLTLLFAMASRLLVGNSDRLMEINAAFFVIHAISILMLQRRVVVASAAFYASSLWLAVLVVTAMYGSVTESGVASLLTVTLVAGVLLGPKVSLGFVGLSTLGIAAIAGLERNGQLPIFVTGVDPRVQTMVLASNLALVGLVVWLDARYPHAADGETEPTWQENERLEATQDRHLRELEALHAIAAAGVEATNEDELISRATQVVGKSLFPINFGVLLIDYERGELVHHSSYSEQEIKEQPPIPLGEGITGLVALSGQAMRISDVSREPRYISVDSDARSELCVPIQIGTRVLGVINVESHEVNAFNQADENLLLTLADQLALALEKIRLLSEAQGRAQELAQTLQQQKELNNLKSEFIETVSNEFRTPLMLIGGYLEMLNAAKSGDLPSEFEEALKIISQRVEDLSKLVDDLASVLQKK